MTNEKYGQTPVSKTPDEWVVVRLGDLIEFVKGKKPEEMGENFKDGYVPYLSTEYLRNNGKTKFVKPSDNTISVNDGDLILLWDGSNAGEFFTGKNGVLSSTMVKIQPKKRDIYQVFLFYLLKTKENYLSGLTRGTGIPHVDKNVLETLNIPLPPLPEQRRIAEVLGTVDSAIQKVGGAIESTERLKNGLMQRLLTKGIGHERFKISKELGSEIPEEWETTNLGEITKVMVGYVGPITEFYVTEGDKIPLLSTTNVSENGIKLEELKYVTPEFHRKNKKSQIFPGDLIIARHGISGSAAIIPNNLKEAQCLNVVIVRHSEKFESEFIGYLFNFKSMRDRLIGWKSGSVQGVVNTKVLEKLKIPLPPIHEQRRIAEILSAVDRKLELERRRKVKLERVKKGLMNELLTGRKRVKL